MFDIGASEFLLIIIVAIVVIGPKDMPLALRTAGRWIGRIRRVSGHFRAGVETMIREAELQEMEQKWREQNAAIMQQPTGSEGGIDDGQAVHAATAEAALLAPDRPRAPETDVPMLPLPSPQAPPP